MAGSDQSANLQGLLAGIANSVGELGAGSEWTSNAVRNFARPQLDMDDPASMSAYGQYLINNGQEAAGQQMLQNAALRTKELRVLDGERQIAQLKAGWTDMLPSQRAAAEKTIAGIGERYGISPLKISATLEEIRRTERQLDNMDLTTANARRQFDISNATALRGQDINQSIAEGGNATSRYVADTQADTTRRGQDITQEIAEGDQSTRLSVAATQAQTEQRGQDIQWRLGQGDQDIRWAQLNEQARANLAQEAIANSGIQYNYDALEEGARQFDQDLSFRNMQLEQEQWMNSATVAQWAEQNKLGWGDLDLRGKQVAITELLANNTIDETKFSQLMRSNQDRRAEELLPHEKGLMQAQIDVLKEDARFKNINWQKVEYELGLAEKLEPQVLKAAKLDNRLRSAQIDGVRARTELTEAEIDSERERPGYIEAQVEAMEARTELEQDQFNWNKRVDETAMELADLNAISARALQNAQAVNLSGLTNSRIFTDKLTMSGLLSDNVSQAERDAYSYAYDPTKPSSVAGARQAFLIQHPGEGKVFDEVATARATTARLLQETSAFAQGLKEGRRVTDQELRDARMPEELIEQLSTLRGEARNNEIQSWLQREIRGEVTGVPTTELIEIYKPVADDMVSEAFGWNVALGLDFDDVNEKNLKAEVAAAMASAAAAGYSDGQRYVAGLRVMTAAVKKSGSNDAISALGRLQIKYGDK